MGSLDPAQGIQDVDLAPREPLPQLVGVQAVGVPGVTGQVGHRRQLRSRHRRGLEREKGGRTGHGVTSRGDQATGPDPARRQRCRAPGPHPGGLPPHLVGCGRTDRCRTLSHQLSPACNLHHGAAVRVRGHADPGRPSFWTGSVRRSCWLRGLWLALGAWVPLGSVCSIDVERPQGGRWRADTAPDRFWVQECRKEDEGTDDVPEAHW